MTVLSILSLTLTNILHRACPSRYSIFFVHWIILALISLPEWIYLHAEPTLKNSPRFSWFVPVWLNATRSTYFTRNAKNDDVINVSGLTATRQWLASPCESFGWPYRKLVNGLVYLSNLFQEEVKPKLPSEIKQINLLRWIKPKPMKGARTAMAGCWTTRNGKPLGKTSSKWGQNSCGTIFCRSFCFT